MNNPSSFILDTHVLLWSILQPQELAENIKKQITLAQESSKLLLSSISLWEIAMLNFKKRLGVYEPIKEFLQSIADIQGLSIIDISPEIAAESVLLSDGFHGDPADRIIVSTARVCGTTLVTRDQKILTCV